jgi:hypothetical protein
MRTNRSKFVIILSFAVLLFCSGRASAQSAPTLSYTNPVNGPVGTSVTIVGNYFGATQGSSTITFNGTAATPTSWSNTQVVAPVPAGATTGPVVVTVGGVASNKVNFTVGTPPTISYTKPVNGPVGTSVTIVGNYFGVPQGMSTITFNGTAATPTSWSNTQVVAPVPGGATTGPVVVTVGGVASNKVNFTVGTPPTISYTNPIDGPVGTSITIVGNYFGATQASSTVTFNGTAATPTSWSNAQIVAPVPNGASTGPVVITAGGMASNRVNFIVGTPPTISYTNPIDGPVGTSITIAGNYFGSAQGTSTITFNGTAATPTSWSNTQIVVPVPNGASTGPVVITAGGMASNSVNFIVGTPPTISYTNPVSAAVSATITIVGNYFGPTQGSSTVTFNGIAATPTSWNNTQIAVPVPSGATTGPLVVTVGGIPSNNVNFTVLLTPTITNLSPNSGPVGTSVTITGTNFGASQGTSTLTFNGTAAMPTSWSSTGIVVPVPSGATTGNAVVTVSGLVSNGVPFTLITPPTITSLSPASGLVGTSVTLTGTNFGASQGNSTVTFNGTSATPTSWSATQIVASVPTGATTGNVLVTISAMASNGVAFTVLSSPTSLKILPATAGIAVGGIQQFTATGTYSNGSTQDLTNSVSWSSSNASAATIGANGIATGVARGSARITGTLGTVTNSAGLMVTTTTGPPTINASVSPQPNAAGWNNSTVRITYGCGGSISAINNCPGPQVVSSEGTNQVVSATVTDNIGRTATATLTLNIDKTPPTLSVASPTDGASLSDANLTVSGTAADSLSGITTVRCNGAPATFDGTNLSCNISLNPGINLVAVRTTDAAGNVSASIMHVNLAAPLPAPTALLITPANINLLVGATQQFSAVDNLGRPRSDATWTVDNTSIATISTDGTPVLTALAVGQVTLTATVQGVSAQIQVHIFGGASLPSGTVIWSAPPVSGFTSVSIIQAVPASADTPDLYSIETDNNGNGLIRAFTSDGHQMWQQSGRTSGPPDGFGGLLIPSEFSIIDLDGQTGMPVWEYDADPGAFLDPNLAVRQDGAILLIEHSSIGPILIAIDGKSGGRTLAIPVPAASSSLTVGTDCFTDQIDQTGGPAGVGGSVTIDPDGTAYIQYGFRQSSTSWLCVPNEPPDILGFSSSELDLLQLHQDGGYITSGLTALANSQFGTTIPDGLGGTLSTWADCSVTNPCNWVISHNSTRLPPIPLINGVGSLVLGENGTAFATDGSKMVSFDINSGSVNWTYQASNFVNIVRATTGGGLAINDSVQGVIQLDPSGVPSAPVQSLQGTTPFDMGTFISDLPDEGFEDWVGAINGQAADAIGPAADVAASDYAMPAGNPENQNAAPSKAVPVKFQQVSEANLDDGTLFFKYSWSSSSGKRSDLASCKVGERVSYPGSPAEFFFPLPMLGAINPNPTVLKFSAIYLGMKDHNLPPPNGFVKPYTSTSFQATQQFWWSCPYYNNGNSNSFVPDITITRQVFQDTDAFWKYQITKSGSTNTIRLPGQ